MNVGELRRALDAYPDDMPVAVIDGTFNSDDLDIDVSIDTAINHPGTRPRGRESWHWKSDEGPPGDPVLVFY